MTKNKLPDWSDLRKRAEANLDRKGNSGGPSPGETEVRRLLHEVQVHQVELELQNEELRQARVEMEAGLERYTDLYDFAPAGYFTLDGQAVIREANLRGAALLGMSRSQLVGMRFERFLARESRPDFGDFLTRLARDRGKETFQATLAGPGGLRLHAYIEGLPLEPPPGDNSGAVTPCRLAVVDITELRHAEEEIKNKTATLAAIFENAPYVMLLVNRDGRVTDINHAGVSMAGRDRQSLLGLLGGEVVGCLNSFDGLGCGRNQECADCPVRTRVERTFATGQAIFNEEGSLSVRRDGQTLRLDLLISTSPVQSGGQTLALVSIVDVSTLRRTQEELRESQVFSQGIIDSSPDCIKVLDLQGRLTYMNQGGLSQMGLQNLGPYLNQAYETFWKESDLEAARVALKKAKAGGRGGFQGYCPTAQGEHKWWDVTVAPIQNARGEVEKLLVVSRDITERRQAEEEKAKLEDQLRQAQKMEAIGTMAGGIAHDFNNILAAILGYAEMARDDALHGKAEPKDLEQIIFSAGRAKDLVKQILAFSRKSTLLFRPLVLNHKVENVVQMLARMMPKEISIKTDLTPELSPINGDAGQLEQVLMNLATNARDSMPEGGQLTIATRDVILDDEFCRQYLEVLPGAYALLSMSDSGQGMDDSTLERMYDPFFTTKEVGKGTGLGLSTVHGIVKSHGGHIFCQSRLGAGTVFDIYLPALPLEDREPALEDASAGKESGGGRRILLVDDEEMLLTVGSRALKSAGFSVLTASSGEDALREFGQGRQPPDLVILDLGMPGMGGLKCLQAILAIYPRAKVLIASGYDAEAQVKQALEAGAADFVAKPFKSLSVNRGHFSPADDGRRQV